MPHTVDQHLMSSVSSSLSFTLSEMSGSITEESFVLSHDDDLETTFTSDYDEEPTTEELLANYSIAAANDGASDQSMSTNTEGSTCRSMSSIATNLSTNSATWAIVSDLESTTTETDESDLEFFANEDNFVDKELANIAYGMATVEEIDRLPFNAEKMLNSRMLTSRESFRSSSLASVSDEENSNSLTKEIVSNVASCDVGSKSADEMNLTRFFDDDQIYKVSHAKEKQEEASDDHDFDIGLGGLQPKQFVASKPPGRKGRTANQLRPPSPVANSPFPLSSNPNAVDDAYNQWAFWQWALYGGPWGGNSGATASQHEFPLSSSEMTFPSYNTSAHFQSRASTAPGCSYNEMPLEDAFPPHASFSHRINYDQPQAFLSARGGYNRVEPGPINFTETGRNRHLESNNYKPRFIPNQTQTGLRDGGGFDGGSSSYNCANRVLSSEPSQRVSNYRQWSGGSKGLSNNEDHLSRETAKLSLNNDDSQKWYEFHDFTGDCRLAESRPTGSNRSSRNGGPRVGNNRTDNRQRGGGYGQGRGSQNYRPGARESCSGYNKPLY